MASVAATSTLAAALAPRRRARPGTGLLPPRRASAVRCSLDSNVSDMGVNAPKGLFPPEPEHYRGPKLKVAIIGAGLAGMSTAVELLDQGHEVDLYESRPFIGGKVGSFVDRQGNHIEMGLHVFFGCYSNLFRLMKKVGADNNLLVKEHTHTFVNKGGTIGELDFRFPVGAPLHGIQAFLRTNQLKRSLEAPMCSVTLRRDSNGKRDRGRILWRDSNGKGGRGRPKLAWKDTIKGDLK